MNFVYKLMNDLSLLTEFKKRADLIIFHYEISNKIYNFMKTPNWAVGAQVNVPVIAIHDFLITRKAENSTLFVAVKTNLQVITTVIKLFNKNISKIEDEKDEITKILHGLHKFLQDGEEQEVVRLRAKQQHYLGISQEFRRMGVKVLADSYLELSKKFLSLAQKIGIAKGTVEKDVPKLRKILEKLMPIIRDLDQTIKRQLGLAEGQRNRINELIKSLKKHGSESENEERAIESGAKFFLDLSKTEQDYYESLEPEYTNFKNKLSALESHFRSNIKTPVAELLAEERRTEAELGTGTIGLIFRLDKEKRLLTRAKAKLGKYAKGKLENSQLISELNEIDTQIFETRKKMPTHIIAALDKNFRAAGKKENLNPADKIGHYIRQLIGKE